jgi:integrase
VKLKWLVSPAHFAQTHRSQIGHDNRCYGEETRSTPRGTAPLSIGEQRYLERAIADADHFSKPATAPTSERAYGSDFADFAAWCDPLGRTWMPASPETVATYLASLAEVGLKASTIRRRKAAIAFMQRWEGQPPLTHDEIVTKTLAGIRLKLGTAPNQAPPATGDIVEQIIRGIPVSTKADLRDRALILLGFAGAFRRSELVGIDVEHVRRVREGIVVQLGHTKTDQEGRGHTVAIPKGCVLRPVAALDAWLAEASIDSGPVFRPVVSGRIGSVHGRRMRSSVSASKRLGSRATAPTACARAF